MLFCGILAFALFFLYDANHLRFHLQPLRFSFLAGVALLTLSIAIEMFRFPPTLHSVSLRVICGIFAALSLGLLILSLFIDLPLSATYAASHEKRAVFTGGVYAICRHPGVLSFALLAFFLWLSSGFSLLSAAIYTGLNILLAWYEDRRVFPYLLLGYEDYQKSTPFLLPSGESLRRGICNYRQRVCAK